MKIASYIKSFVLFQARDDAGLDWHDTDRPVEKCLD